MELTDGILVLFDVGLDVFDQSAICERSVHLVRSQLSKKLQEVLRLLGHVFDARNTVLDASVVVVEYLRGLNGK